MKYISVFFQYLRSNGVKVTFERCISFIKRKLKRSHAVQSVISKRPIDVMTSVEDVVKADFVAEPYVAPKKVDKAKLNIGWVLSPISIGSGGQHTIARFAKSLQERGHNVTFFIYESISQQPADYSHQLLKEHFDIDVLSVSIFALPSGRAETLARKAALFENICFVCCRPHGCMSKRRDVFG